jgi:hypothetical protein
MQVTVLADIQPRVGGFLLWTQVAGIGLASARRQTPFLANTNNQPKRHLQDQMASSPAPRQTLLGHTDGAAMLRVCRNPFQVEANTPFAGNRSFAWHRLASDHA